MPTWSSDLSLVRSAPSCVGQWLGIAVFPPFALPPPLHPAWVQVTEVWPCPPAHSCANWLQLISRSRAWVLPSRAGTLAPELHSGLQLSMYSCPPIYWMDGCKLKCLLGGWAEGVSNWKIQVPSKGSHHCVLHIVLSRSVVSDSLRPHGP